jgi:predicted transcriptional regulator
VGRVIPIRLTDGQQRVYILLREGNAQSLVARKIGYRKGTVSKMASRLTEQGFLTRVTDKQPYLYGDGPRSKELDKVIDFKRVSKSASDEVSAHDTSVGNLSPETQAVRTVLSHHVKIRFKVEKLGDTDVIRVKDLETGAFLEAPFLNHAPYLDHNNVRKTKGKLLFSGSELSVELEETPSCTWFYVHLPKISLTRDELKSGKWEEIYKRIGQETGNYLQKWAGWKLGLMELCPNWKPHFASEDPRILNNIVSRASAKNHNGSVWTSDSEGRRELETSDPEYAQIIVSIPEALYELKLEMKDLVEITSMIKAAVENLARAEALEIEERAMAEGLGK